MTVSQPSVGEAEFYLLFEPRWRGLTSYWQDDDGNPILDKVQCTKVTQSRPAVGRNGGVVVKMRATFTPQTFLPLMPKAVLEIDHTNSEVVSVTVEEPDDAAE